MGTAGLELVFQAAEPPLAPRGRGGGTDDGGGGGGAPTAARAPWVIDAYRRGAAWPRGTVIAHELFGALLSKASDEL